MGRILLPLQLLALSCSSTAWAQMDAERDLSQKGVRLLLVHMIFMIITWLLLVPLAVLIARYGRTYFTWYPHHRNIQIASFLTFTVGIFLAVAYRGGEALDETHHRIGVALYALFILQAALGLTAHKMSAKNKKLRWLGFIHAPVGLIAFGLSIWTIQTGFDLWEWDAGQAPKIFVYVWAGFLALLYLAGLAFLPREIKQNRERREEKRSSDMEATSLNASPTTSNPFRG